MKNDWIVVICTIAVIAMGVIAFYYEQGFGTGKDNEDKNQKKEGDSSMDKKK